MENGFGYYHEEDGVVLGTAASISEVMEMIVSRHGTTDQYMVGEMLGRHPSDYLSLDDAMERVDGKIHDSILESAKDLVSMIMEDIRCGAQDQVCDSDVHMRDPEGFLSKVSEFLISHVFLNRGFFWEISNMVDDHVEIDPAHVCEGVPANPIQLKRSRWLYSGDDPDGTVSFDPSCRHSWCGSVGDEKFFSDTCRGAMEAVENRLANKNR